MPLTPTATRRTSRSIALIAIPLQHIALQACILHLRTIAYTQHCCLYYYVNACSPCFPATHAVTLLSLAHLFISACFAHCTPITDIALHCSDMPCHLLLWTALSLSAVYCLKFSCASSRCPGCPDLQDIVCWSAGSCACFCCFNRQTPLLQHSHLTHSRTRASFPLLHHGYIYTIARYRPHSHQHEHSSPTKQLMKHNASKTLVCISCSRHTLKQRCCSIGSCCSSNLRSSSPSSSARQW